MNMHVIDETTIQFTVEPETAKLPIACKKVVRKLIRNRIY